MTTKADVLAARAEYEDVKVAYVERRGWRNRWNLGWSRGTVYNRTLDEAVIITMAEEDQEPTA